jgi:RNA polymerase sigma factor (sigma-70 family)
LEPLKKSNVTDHELIQDFCQNQHQESLANLFRRHLHLCYGTALKYLKNKEKSEDIVADLYLKLQVDLCRFQILDFPAWVCTVTRNMALGSLRKGKTTAMISLDEIFMEKIVAEHHDDNREMMLQALEKCLSELQEKQRTCIELFFIQNKSYSEIQEITQWDFKTVKTQIQNGKRMLRVQLEKMNQS